MLSYALSSCRPIKSFEGLISIILECCYFEDWKLPGLEFPFKLEKEKQLLAMKISRPLPKTVTRLSTC